MFSDNISQSLFMTGWILVIIDKEKTEGMFWYSSSNGVYIQIYRHSTLLNSRSSTFTSKFRAPNLVVSDLHSETKDPWFVYGSLCRGEYCAVITRLMSKCL